MPITLRMHRKTSVAAAIAAIVVVLTGIGGNTVCGCSPRSHDYRVICIDDNVFADHIIIAVESSDGKCYFIVSQRDRSMKEPEGRVGYEELREDSVYSLSLERYSEPPRIGTRDEATLYYMDLNEKGTRNRPIFVWKNKKIQNVVYKCPEIRDKYVRVTR